MVEPRILKLSLLLMLAVHAGITRAETPPSGKVTTLPDGTLLGGIRDLTLSGARVVFAPVMLPMSLLAHRRAGYSRKDAVQETLRSNAPYLAGYMVLHVGLDRLLRAYFQIDQSAYEEITNARMAPAPRKVLFINAIDPDDGQIYPAARSTFVRHYGDHPNAQLMEVKSYEDFLSQIRALPQDASFDRIEIFGHGRPGGLALGSVSKKNPVVTVADIGQLRAIHPDIAAPGADLRMIACSLGVGTPTSPLKGEVMLKEFGATLLPKGGTVFAATRNILTVDLPRTVKIVQAGYGVANFVQLVQMLPSSWRDYRQSTAKAVEIRIPDQLMMGSGCVAPGLRALR